MQHITVDSVEEPLPSVGSERKHDIFQVLGQHDMLVVTRNYSVMMRMILQFLIPRYLAPLLSLVILGALIVHLTG